MKIINKITTEHYTELHVQNSFLGFKWISIYRKLPTNAILKYKHPNTYFEIGLTEYYEIKNLFDVEIIH